MVQTYWLGIGWIVGLGARSLHVAGWWLLPLVAIGLWLGRRDSRQVRTWMATGFVALFAWGYFGWRMPIPRPADVSQQAPQSAATAIARIQSVPKLKRSGRLQVWAEVLTYSDRSQAERDATGKLYATYPRDDATPDVRPGQIVWLRGSLYQPQAADNPGSFSFRRFLAQQGSFAGMSVRELEIRDRKSTWGGWTLRQRIRRGLVTGLGDRAGELLSALVLGAATSQVPFELQDSFRTAGLAHVTAASGFHVVVLIGLLERLTGWVSPRRQAALVLACLAGYAVLTGGSPSVLRAAVMGGAAVLVRGWSDRHAEDRHVQRQLNPVGVLLVAVVLLLAWQPLWIDTIGFQLSATATLGLLVSATPIEAALTWIPSNWARALSVPLAAAIWTLPVQLLAFGKIPTYSLLANGLAMPLVVPLTVAGFIICGLCAIAPGVGAIAAKLLYVPLVALANGVTAIASLPGASFHSGTISFVQCAGLYLMLGAWVWRSPATQPTLQSRWLAQSRRWGSATLAGILAISLLWPGPKIRVIAFATADAPVLAIRTRHSTTLVNSGTAETVQYVVRPWLRSEGIRRIQYAIALTPDGRSNGGWDELVATLPIQQFWRSDRQAIASSYAEGVAALAARGATLNQPQAGDRLWREGDIQLQVVGTQPMALQLSIGDTRWLLLGTMPKNRQQTLLKSTLLVPPIDWVWWNGDMLSDRFVETLRIQHGLVSGQLTEPLSRELIDRNQYLNILQTSIFETRDLGAVEWTLKGITLARTDREW